MVHEFSGKWSNWPIFLYNCTLGYLLQEFAILVFGVWSLVIFWAWCAQRGVFLANQTFSICSSIQYAPKKKTRPD